ncbi:MAG: hypothetical protein J0L64_01250 [Acidobacteria bacterium]|nr:hypothetical protein [Acidobacteriota bacterium]
MRRLMMAVLLLAVWLLPSDSQAQQKKKKSANAPRAMASNAGGRVAGTEIGHEFRHDDLPSIAQAPDGTLWAAWLSFVGDRDDIGIRPYANGAWGNLQWVPNTSGDAWLPQVGVDAQNRVWVVWSQMVGANWDLYARRFDPAKQEWGPLERLTSDPLPDVNPRLAPDGTGGMAVVWQAFRARKDVASNAPVARPYANIMMKALEGEKWGADVRVTDHAANDWEPAIAFDVSGNAWVAWDTYAKGNYDVMLSRVSGGKAGAAMAVAESARFEARATVAVDTSGRVWVAYEAGAPGWGKDQGYIVRSAAKGVVLGGVREPRIRCYDNGTWRDPAQPVNEPFSDSNTYQPHVFSDGAGSVFVVAKTRYNQAVQPRGNRGYWEYRVSHLDGAAWSAAKVLDDSRGRSSTRMNAVLAKDRTLWMVWDSDTRGEAYYHKPKRQRVIAGKLEAAAATTLQWGTPPSETLRVELAHANEGADLKAIRGYSVVLNGKKNSIVRGDFHRHTELSWDGGGASDGSLQDFYRYMVDAASMDFGASTDHQGGAWPYWWWYTQKMTDMYHVPGLYLPIFGYERSATYPNGHRNMFFAKRSESRVSPFFMRSGTAAFGLGVSPLGDEPGVGSGDLVENDTKLLYEEIRGRNGIAISHTSGTRMGTDWRDNDPELEPVVEIFQGARTSYEKLGFPYVAAAGKDDQHMNVAGYQPAGMVNNAWAKGYKLGIVTSSDHGSTHISYALVYTDNVSRQGVLDGIRRRHTYGATDNIILDVRMGRYFMGDELKTVKQLPITVKARGTAKVARVEVIRDSEVVYTAEPGTQDVSLSYLDKADLGARHYYYVRLMQADGQIAWSSPFFVNYK